MEIKIASSYDSLQCEPQNRAELDLAQFTLWVRADQRRCSLQASRGQQVGEVEGKWG